MKITKLVLIGFITTFLRAMLQLIMPAGEPSVLAPSVFVKNGTMPLAFLIYGTFAYTLIAAIFLFLHETMSGNRVVKGLNFGILCSLLWSIYLLEPLAHGALLDKITYPIVDSAVLIVMGLLLGRFIAKSSPSKKYKVTKNTLIHIGMITVWFLAGRLIEYKVFNIYSMFDKQPIYSILWVVGTGIVIGTVFNYISPSITKGRVAAKSMLFGVGIFGVNLFVFNFFIPIVFDFELYSLKIFGNSSQHIWQKLRTTSENHFTLNWIRVQAEMILLVRGIFGILTMPSVSHQTQ